MPLVQSQILGPADPTRPPYTITFTETDECADPTCQSTSAHWNVQEEMNGVGSMRRLYLLVTLLYDKIRDTTKGNNNVPIETLLLCRVLTLVGSALADVADEQDAAYAARKAAESADT